MIIFFVWIFSQIIKEVKEKEKKIKSVKMTKYFFGLISTKNS